MASVVRYTRLVAFGKHMLWLLIALVLGIVVWIGSDNTGDNGARMVFSAVSKSETLQNMMLKPHYQGVDANGRPYTVIAEKGIQVDKDTVTLSVITADIMREEGKWVALHAATGEINTATSLLKLGGGVDLFYDGGFEFRTDHALIDMPKGSAYGDSHIEGQGPLGTIEADGFTITGRGKLIRFNGSVRMKLYR